MVKVALLDVIYGVSCPPQKREDDSTTNINHAAMQAQI
jgi:hypothetical protein